MPGRDGGMTKRMTRQQTYLRIQGCNWLEAAQPSPASLYLGCVALACVSIGARRFGDAVVGAGNGQALLDKVG